LIVLLAPAGAGAAVPRWSLGELMRALDGRPVVVGGRTVRVQTESTLCGGEGSSVRVNGVRRWSRFACTFTTFGPSGIERDVDFRVAVVDRRRLRITSAAWVPSVVGP
jgi:hypothetical protein